MNFGARPQKEVIFGDIMLTVLHASSVDTQLETALAVPISPTISLVLEHSSQWTRS
jgi:hypothetical protein